MMMMMMMMMMNNNTATSTKDITINITGIIFPYLANSKEYVKMFSDESTTKYFTLLIDNCLLTNFQQPRTRSSIEWEDINACLGEVGCKIVPVHSSETDTPYLADDSGCSKLNSHPRERID
jgi:hypothetical protein